MANAWQSKKLGAWSSEGALLKKKGVMSSGAKPADTTSGSASEKPKRKSNSPECAQPKAAERPPFDSAQVRRFLSDQFAQFSKQATRLVTEDSTDWNTAQSKGWKTKRYGCLSELERLLK